jgi:hypothetical protein
MLFLLIKKEAKPLASFLQNPFDRALRSAHLLGDLRDFIAFETQPNDLSVGQGEMCQHFLDDQLRKGEIGTLALMRIW